MAITISIHLSGRLSCYLTRRKNMPTDKFCVNCKHYSGAGYDVDDTPAAAPAPTAKPPAAAAPPAAPPAPANGT